MSWGGAGWVESALRDRGIAAPDEPLEVRQPARDLIDLAVLAADAAMVPVAVLLLDERVSLVTCVAQLVAPRGVVFVARGRHVGREAREDTDATAQLRALF